MSRKFWATMIAPVFLFASIHSALAMDGADLVSKLDTTAPKFNTAGCKSARDTMAQYNGHVAERVLEGVFMLAAFGGIFAIPGALSQNGQEAKIANYLLQNLQTECGRQTLFPAYLEAATHGEAPAQAWVAQSYESGDGAARDVAQAIAWYQKSVDQGFEPAMINLGTIYFRGDGVPVDQARAIALWRTAADKGSPGAEASLGEAYYDGTGLPQDYVRAIALWRDAIKKSEPSAQADLGKALLEGRGIAQNATEALQHFRTASWNGSALAQYELGIMYESGAAVPQSDVAAYRWYSVAEKNGFAQASVKRQRLQAKLTPEQMQQQDGLAAACFKSQFMNCP